MNVKQSRLLAVVGLVLIAFGFAVVVAWAVVGPTVYNSIPFVGAGLVAAGIVVNRRSTRG